MDAITLLRDDHRSVELLFKRFEKTGDRAHVEKRQIVDRIIEELSVHAAIEEQVFYPVARATLPATETVALESLEEHHVVKWLLSELADLDPAHERFQAKVTVLIENVRHHVKEEEAEFFPIVRAGLGRTALAEMGDALAAAKQAAPTHPHPRASNVSPANGLVGTLTGVVDRVGDNLSGIAQGGVTAVQEMIGRIVGSQKPLAAPTGNSIARRRANDVRRRAAGVTDRAHQAGRMAAEGAAATVRTASSGVTDTVATAKRSARATAAAAQPSTSTSTSTKPAVRKAANRATKPVRRNARATATTAARVARDAG